MILVKVICSVNVENHFLTFTYLAYNFHKDHVRHALLYQKKRGLHYTRMGDFTLLTFPRLKCCKANPRLTKVAECTSLNGSFNKEGQKVINGIIGSIKRFILTKIY